MFIVSILELSGNGMTIVEQFESSLHLIKSNLILLLFVGS